MATQPNLEQPPVDPWGPPGEPPPEVPTAVDPWGPPGEPPPEVPAAVDPWGPPGEPPPEVPAAVDPWGPPAFGPPDFRWTPSQPDTAIELGPGLQGPAPVVGVSRALAAATSPRLYELDKDLVPVGIPGEDWNEPTLTDPAHMRQFTEAESPEAAQARKVRQAGEDIAASPTLRAAGAVSSGWAGKILNAALQNIAPESEAAETARIRYDALRSGAVPPAEGWEKPLEIGAHLAGMGPVFQTGLNPILLLGGMEAVSQAADLT
ncbi:MAG: hypothetical protein M0R06_25640, partial [Sphaerochaeta sp.]|nr:hypothetical protein [Sphaerochaeta sp.]